MRKNERDEEYGGGGGSVGSEERKRKERDSLGVGNIIFLPL